MRKHPKGQAKLGSEIKHLEHSGNDQECGQRSHSIATKHQAHKFNNRKSWIKSRDKSEAGDQ